MQHDKFRCIQLDIIAKQSFTVLPFSPFFPDFGPDLDFFEEIGPDSLQKVRIWLKIEERTMKTRLITMRSNPDYVEFVLL